MLAGADPKSELKPRIDTDFYRSFLAEAANLPV
jgi:hypothetical protein